MLWPLLLLLLSAVPALAAPQAVLTWDYPVGWLTGIRVEGQTIGGEWRLLAQLGPDVRTFTDTAIVRGTSYCWRYWIERGTETRLAPVVCATVPQAGPVPPPVPVPVPPPVPPATTWLTCTGYTLAPSRVFSLACTTKADGTPVLTCTGRFPGKGKPFTPQCVTKQ